MHIKIMSSYKTNNIKSVFDTGDNSVGYILDKADRISGEVNFIYNLMDEYETNTEDYPYNTLMDHSRYMNSHNCSLSMIGSMFSTMPISEYDAKYLQILTTIDGISLKKIRYRMEKNKMRENITGVFNTVSTRTSKMMSEFLTTRIKNRFGKEFIFFKSGSELLIDDITNKFIKKYDKDFDIHSQKGTNENPRLINVQFVIPLDYGFKNIPNTFLYVATGTKIGNLEELFMLSSSTSSSDMYIYICGKHMIKYVSELENLIHKVFTNNELGIFTVDSSLNIYGDNNDRKESMDVTWSKFIPRDLSTLFFTSGEIEKITNHIDRFNTNEDFYLEKQLLYKTGILLYGKPGTGKTSLVKALATKYNRSIVNINIAHLDSIDLNRLTQSINVDEYRKYIVLFEDIDTLFLNRDSDNADKEDRNVINKLLQFLDSNTSPNNVIFIATTNHLERLDEALLRDGRFDLKVFVDEVTIDAVYKFCNSFGLDQSQTEDVIKEFESDRTLPEKYNQSMLQTRILNRIDNKKRDDTIVDTAELKIKEIEDEKKK